MEVREAGDGIFHRSTHLSTAPCPRRMWTARSLQGQSFIRWCRGRTEGWLFARALPLPGTEENGLTDVHPVCVVLQKELPDPWEAVWSQGGRKELSVEEVR